jgi:uncharacterized protein (TIGR02444 family)
MEARQDDNDFWRFSLSVYAAPGVADECLALQDTRGVDVNLLLFCAWLGGARRGGMVKAEIEVAGRAVAADAAHRVVAPFPVALRDGKAHVRAKPGVKYQLHIDGRRIVEVASQGKDVVNLVGE